VIALDTNVLVRYLTKDDEKQWQQAAAIIENAEPCFISNIVLCELVWVLEGRCYKLPKNEILKVLQQMLSTSTLQFESRSVLYQAIHDWEDNKADFSDYLIGRVALANSSTTLVTFDRKLAGLSHIQLLN